MKPELTAQILGMYIGRPCDVLDTDGEFLYSGILSLPNIDYWVREMYVLRPHLRRMGSITEEECLNIHKDFFGFEYSGIIPCIKWVCLGFDGNSSFLQDARGYPNVWLYLLSRGFDLFGLIDAKLAKEVSE